MVEGARQAFVSSVRNRGPVARTGFQKCSSAARLDKSSLLALPLESPRRVREIEENPKCWSLKVGRVEVLADLLSSASMFKCGPGSRPKHYPRPHCTAKRLFSSKLINGTTGGRLESHDGLLMHIKYDVPAFALCLFPVRFLILSIRNSGEGGEHKLRRHFDQWCEMPTA